MFSFVLTLSVRDSVDEFTVEHAIVLCQLLKNSRNFYTVSKTVVINATLNLELNRVISTDVYIADANIQIIIICVYYKSRGTIKVWLTPLITR